jgi:hypothetical protein
MDPRLAVWSAEASARAPIATVLYDKRIAPEIAMILCACRAASKRYNDRRPLTLVTMIDAKSSGATPGDDGVCDGGVFDLVVHPIVLLSIRAFDQSRFN